MVGEIHLASIRFTNDAAAKARPLLIINKNQFGDLIFLPLTTNLNLKGEILNPEDLLDGRLPITSMVICDKPSVISPYLLIKKIGMLKPEIFEKAKLNLMEFLNS